MANSSKRWGNQYACSSSASSMAILLFVVPLVVVFGLVSLLGPKTSNWVFISNSYPWLWNSQSSSPSLNLTGASNSSSEFPPLNDDVLGLRSSVVVVDMHSIEEAHSDDSLQNRSSSPPLSIEEAVPPTLEQPVRELHLLHMHLQFLFLFSMDFIFQLLACLFLPYSCWCFCFFHWK